MLRYAQVNVTVEDLTQASTLTFIEGVQVVETTTLASIALNVSTLSVSREGSHV